MSITDPIADMLTRIRNAGAAKFNSTDIPGSKLKVAMAKVLKEEGYIRNYKFVKDGKQGVLRIYLKYHEGVNAIYRLEMVSKQSRRVYAKSADIAPVYNGTGIAILSTSQGLMTDKRAKAENIGGEVLCKIW